MNFAVPEERKDQLKTREKKDHLKTIQSEIFQIKMNLVLLTFGFESNRKFIKHVE